MVFMICNIILKTIDAEKTVIINSHVMLRVYITSQNSDSRKIGAPLCKI